MNLGAQIKKYRNSLAFSQDELAEKLYVSRQSISNWENNKTYPDIKSLLMMSEIFKVSVDELIKGDINMMKQEINEQELEEFRRDSLILNVLFVVMIIAPIPLTKMFGWIGFGIWVIIFIAAFYYGFRVDRHKKKHNIQTYKEILVFMEGETLSEIEKAREDGKRPYQKIMIVLSLALISLCITICIYLICCFI